MFETQRPIRKHVRSRASIGEGADEAFRLALEALPGFWYDFATNVLNP